jgi:hypothetical protein
MASAGTESQSTITLGQRLRRKPALLAKVRRLDETLTEVFGKDTPIEWDLEPAEKGNPLVLHVGEPGKGECTRSIPESLLDDTAGLKKLAVEMKGYLEVVQQYLREVEQLFQQMKTWLSQARPAYQVEEAPTTVKEVLSGDYTAKKLLIRFKKKKAEVVPQGVWWVTTEGCVALIDEDDFEDQFMLSHPEGGWLWVQERPKVDLHLLTGEVFLKLVKDCMR